MATPDILDNRNKAVVAFLDGRRLKGYIYNFSAQKDRFRLFLNKIPSSVKARTYI